MSLIVINLFIYQVTGSAFFMGNIAGVLADKYDRRYLIIIADLIRATLMLSMIFLHDYIFPIYFIIFGIAICDRLYVSFGLGEMSGVIASIAKQSRSHLLYITGLPRPLQGLAMTKLNFSTGC